MEEWAEIRRLHKAEGMGVKTIARRLGVARNMVLAKACRVLYDALVGVFTSVGFHALGDEIFRDLVIAGW